MSETLLIDRVEEMSLTGANHTLLEPLTKGYAYKWLNVCNMG